MNDNKGIWFYISALIMAVFLGSFLYVFGLVAKRYVMKFYTKKAPIYWVKVPAAIEEVKLAKIDPFVTDPELGGLFFDKKLEVTYNYYFKGKKYTNDSIGIRVQPECFDDFHTAAYKKIRNNENIYVWINPYYPTESAIVLDKNYHYAILFLWICVVFFLILILLNRVTKRKI